MVTEAVRKVAGFVPMSAELMDDVTLVHEWRQQQLARGLSELIENEQARSVGLDSVKRPDGPWPVWTPTWLDRTEWAIRRSTRAVTGRARATAGRVSDAWYVLRHGLPDHEDEVW